MPAPTDCQPCCSDIVSENTPGSAGQSAFTTTTNPETIPANAGDPVTFEVGNTDWMAIGETVFVSDDVDWAHFRVTAIPSSTSFTGVFLEQSGDGANPAVMGAGSRVVASGDTLSVADPLPIANGGTGATTQAGALSNILGAAPLPIANGGTAGATKAAALSALGIAQDATADNNAALAYDITNTPAQITGVSASVATTGLYRLEACTSVDYTGTTFASSRTLTISIRNITSGTNLITITRNTGIHTTTTQPTIDYYAFVTATLTAADVIQVYISLDTVESAGSSVVFACNLLLTPIAI